MNRRGFLKVLTALGATIALPVGATTQKEANALLASNAAPLGLMRETFAYEITTDSILVRFDICTGIAGKLARPEDVQLGIDMRFSESEIDSRIDEARQIAKQTFDNELTSRGLTWDNIQPMPIPFGYARP